MVEGLHLSPRHRKEIVALLHKHLPGVEVWAYGSRVNGRSHDGSDLDLVLRSPQLAEIDASQLAEITESFRKSTVPFLIDARDWVRLPESFHWELERAHVVMVEREERDVTGKTIADFVNIVMGQSPPGDTVSGGVGLPLLNGPTEFGPHHPTPIQFTPDARKIAHPGDLLFCVRGSTTGRMNWADKKYAIGRGVAAIRHRCASELQPFVRAVIEFELPKLLVQATGSTFPNVSASQLASIPYPNLSAAEQRAIAHILGTLDDKIELNRRMNETLEAMVRALFKSWFVDFDPVRAKMAGRDTGLPSHLADLFPDRLVDSELGEIPEGWEVESLEMIAQLEKATVKPEDHATEEFEHFSLPAYDSGQLPALDLGSTIKSNKTLVPSQAVLLSKLNPEIQRVWLPASASSRRQISSTEFLVFTPKPPIGRAGLYALFNTQSFRDLLKGMVTGTSKSHQRVAPKSLVTQGIISPADILTNEFEALAWPMLERTLRNKSENHTLAALRDTLLPKLISGELRAKQVEAIA